MSESTPTPGWRELLLRYQATDGVYAETTPLGAMVIGYPLCWVLFEDGVERVTPCTATCAATSTEVTCHTGMRCARCAQPFRRDHLRLLGGPALAVPACRACAPAIREALNGDSDE